MKKCAVTGGETKLTLALIKAWCHWQGASTDMMIKTRDLLYCLKPLWYFFWSHTIIQYQAIYFELSRTTICRFALTCQVPIETTAQTFFEWMWFDTGDLQDSRYLSWRCQTNYCSPPGSLLTSDREVRVLFFLALKSSKGDVNIHWKISITITYYKEKASLAELLENIKMIPNIAIYT